MVCLCNTPFGHRGSNKTPTQGWETFSSKIHFWTTNKLQNDLTLVILSLDNPQKLSFTFILCLCLSAQPCSFKTWQQQKKLRSIQNRKAASRLLLQWDEERKDRGRRPETPATDHQPGVGLLMPALRSSVKRREKCQQEPRGRGPKPEFGSRIGLTAGMRAA